jgi:hypothetical protein
VSAGLGMSRLALQPRPADGASNARPHLAAAIDRDAVRGAGSQPDRMAQKRHRRLTSTFNFAVPPNTSAPSLENARLAALPKIVQCIPNVVLGTSDGVLPGIPYRVPYPRAMPTQRNRSSAWNFQRALLIR